MFDIAGIADLQFAGNVLASEHGSGQCCVVETDACTRGKGVVNIRKITGFYRIGLVVIVSDIIDHICIDSFQDVHIIHILCDKRFCFTADLAVFGKIHVLVRIQKRKKFIFKLHS